MLNVARHGRPLLIYQVAGGGTLVAMTEQDRTDLLRWWGARMILNIGHS